MNIVSSEITPTTVGLEWNPPSISDWNGILTNYNIGKLFGLLVITIEMHLILNNYYFLASKILLLSGQSGDNNIPRQR